eukprot:scaffold10909_cov172-Amphora_coffeaeformis.AAC.8
MESNAAAVKAADNNNNNNNNNNSQTIRKIDPITALQDAIDGLSLGIFESLRSLRDAVAPESGNLGVNPNQNNNTNNNPNNEPDIEELWSSYKHGDQKVRDMMHKGDPDHPVIQKREDFIRMHAKMEMQKDTDLVFRLAGTVLSKSQDIDDQVERLPGMEWTRDEQMQRIKELLEQNETVKQELQETYNGTLALRNNCRRTIKANTSKSLEIKEEKA